MQISRVFSSRAQARSLPASHVRRVACAVAVFALSAYAWGQATFPRDPRQALTQYKIDNWQTEQGLPLNTVQALLQTRDGYLWVGTGGGLARFDGVRFTTFESQLAQLSSQSIFGFLEDRDGNLWIGYSGGAAVFRDGRFKIAFGNEVTEGRRVWAFARAPDGAIWAATENGLVRWKDGGAHVFKTGNGPIANRLRSIAFDRKGRLWIATSGDGLLSFDGARFAALTPANGFPNLAVRSVLADPSGGVWAATAGSGLVHVGEDGRLSIYGVKEGLPTDQLTALARDANGSLWIGTWGAGLCRMRDGRFTAISTEGGLAGGQIWSVYADREGSVWVGTWVGGLNRLRNRDFVVLGTPEGLSHDNVRSVLHARDGVTWVATAGGGVNRIDHARITAITAKHGLPSDETSTLMEDRDGSIWVGTYTGGVARITEERVESFGLASGLPNVDVRSLFQDRSGTIWAGTLSGLARFDGQKFARVNEPGAPPEGASVILQDRVGTLWFATNEGLYFYRNGAFHTLTRRNGLASNWIMSLYEDAEGSLWIGTNGEGLNRLRNGRIATIRTSDGLWDGVVQVILEDRFGNMWMTCNRGFFRVAHTELDAFAEGRIRKIHSVGYGPGDALRSTTFAGGHQASGAIDAAGHLWLPSFSGLVIVDPAQLPGSGAPPVVRLESVAVNGAEVGLDHSVVLPPGSAPLAIRYTTTRLRDAERARFRYRMDGTSGGWVDAGRNREAFFPALPAGSYQFHVAASLDGENWSSTATPLSIRVRPYFFQTPWFIAFAVLIIVGVTATVLRLRTRHLRLQKEEMERLVAEKTEELRLANEHLARISFIDVLTGLANRRRFNEALEQEWQRARRFEQSLALVLVDVDLFKAYNDTLGHVEGDKCLAAVADVLLHAGRRAGDLVARYGGEEFVVLIPGADAASAVAFAEHLREACEARAIPHPASSVCPFVTISLGVAARVPTEETTSAMLVSDADAALYRAKREGRNRVSFVVNSPSEHAVGE